MIKLGSADKSSSGCRTFPGRRATARRCVEPKRATIWASISSQLNKLRFTFSTVFNTVGATIRAGADRRATATPTKFIKTLKWPPMAGELHALSAEFLSPGRFAHLVSRFGWFMQ